MREGKERPEEGRVVVLNMYGASYIYTVCSYFSGVCWQEMWVNTATIARKLDQGYTLGSLVIYLLVFTVFYGLNEAKVIYYCGKT